MSNAFSNTHNVGSSLISCDSPDYLEEVQIDKSSFIESNDECKGKSGVQISAGTLQSIEGLDAGKAQALHQNMIKHGYLTSDGFVTEKMENLEDTSKMQLDSEFEAYSKQVQILLKGFIAQALEIFKSSMEMSSDNITHIKEDLTIQENEMIKASNEKKEKRDLELSKEQDKKATELEEKIKAYEREKGFIPPEVKNGFLI